MEIVINEELCIGCGRCTEDCPEAFRLNFEKMKAEVVENNKADFKEVDKAANKCPTDAITVHNK